MDDMVVELSVDEPVGVGFGLFGFVAFCGR